MKTPIFKRAIVDRIIAAKNLAGFRCALPLLFLLVSGATTAQVTYGPTSGNATTGATLYAACSGCHGASAQSNITIRNAANAGRAINLAMINGMAGLNAGSYNDTQENDLAAYISNLFSSTATNPSGQAVVHNSGGTAIALPNIYIASAFGEFSSISTVVAPSRGSVSYSGTTATYTPTAGQCGTDSFSWRAQGPFGVDTYQSNTRSSSVSIASTAAPNISTSAGTISGTVNSAIATYTPVSTGGTPLSYSIAAGALPTGLTLNANGTITGAPTQAGSFSATLAASNCSGGNLAGQTGINGLRAIAINIAAGAQAISFGALANKLTTDAPFVISATGGGSGNPVIFTASGVCTAGGTNGSTITLSGVAGACTVTANQAGNGNYTMAPAVMQSFMISDATAEVFPPSCVMPPGWVTSPGAVTGWGAATDFASTGSCSLKSNPIVGTFTATTTSAHGARVQITANFNDGTISVSRKVSSEPNYKCFRVLIDGVQQGVSGTCGNLGFYFEPDITAVGASGEQPFTTINIPVLAGTKTVVFSYDRDSSSFVQGSDAAWIDSVTMPLSTSINSALLAIGVFNQAFSYFVTATNFPVSITATGLPPGLSFNPVTREISGTPTAAGNFVVTLGASNPAGVNPGATDTKTLTVLIVRASQSITFDPLNNRLTTAPPFTVSAIGGGSGNVVTFTASGVCTSSGMNGTTITLTGVAGTCTVTARQLGNTNYDDASDIARSFEVSLASSEIFPAQCTMPPGWTVPVGATTGWAVSASEESSTGACSLKSMPMTTSAAFYRADIQFTGTFAAGNVSFKYRTSSEQEWKCLQFFIDGAAQNLGGTCINRGLVGASGESAWISVSVPITAGTRTLTWRYDKDSLCCVAGRDAVWIDDVVMPQFTLTVTKAGAGSGTISSTPAGINSCSGTCNTVISGSVLLTPSPGFLGVFAGWSGGGCSGTGNCTVTMDASKSVTGTFNNATPPGALQNVVATAGNGGVTITFNAPASDGGSPITSYGGNCAASGQTTVFAGGSNTPTPLGFSGMTNGVQYTCTVGAGSFAGSGPTTIVTVTPRTVPGAPTGVSAARGNQQATVSFTAPMSTGGSMITGYTATCTAAGNPTRTATGGASPLTVTSMVNGVAYSCSVVATNIAGNSPPSSSVNVTPFTTASAPRNLTVLPRDGGALVSYDPPLDDGGNPVLAYNIDCSPGGNLSTSASPPLTITGLTNGVATSCTVRGVNAAGNGAAASFPVFTPNVQLGATYWTQVCASCHGTPPSGNQLNGAGTTNTVLSDILANLAPMNGIAQINLLTAAELTAIANYIAQQLPTAPLVTAFNTPKLIDVGSQITLGTYSFESIAIVTGPTSGTLSAITGTTFTYTPNMGFTGTDTFTFRGERATPTVLNGDPRTITITVSPPTTPSITSAPTASGTNGVAFNYQITATNSPTSFGASGLPAGLTVNTMTGAITGTPSVGGTFMATVTASNAGGPGTAGLTITLNPAAQFITFSTQTIPSRAFSPSPTNSFVLDPVATASSMLAVSYVSKTPGVCDVTGSTVNMLAAGLCTIGANQIGNASFGVAAEVTQSVTITPILPGAPTIGAATAGNLQASIAFAAPANTGGIAITSYVASCTPSGAGSNAVSPITITGLTNGTLYTCSVRAINSIGTGPASGTVTVTPVPTPTAPTITSAASFGGFTVNQAGTTFNVTATGTPSTFTFSITGTLPSGLSFSTTTGLLSGTPTQAGTFPLTFGASNTTMPNASQPFTLTVAKTSQTISFANPGTQVFQITPVPLSATATSSLAVSFVSTTLGVCTISGANVLLVSLGTCSITAQQLGDANFNAAPTVSQSFSIVQGGQTITFGPQTSPFPFIQGAIFNLSPVATASSALPVAYTSLTNTVCTIAGTTVSILRAGQCTIAANQAGNANVSAAAQVTQTITLTGSVPGAPVIGTVTPSGGRATVSFTAPASDGGSAITLYTATCGGITGSGAASPVVVNGLTNGVQVSCSVTATNATGTGAASGSVNVTPNPLAGAAIWATKCQSCHGLTPIGTRLNVGGTTPAVMAHAITTQIGMSSLPSLNLANFPDVDRIAVAEFVRDFIPAVTASTPINTAVDISVGSQIFINTAITGFTSLQVVAPPTNGTLSAFFGTSVTYTPNPGFIGTDTFTYRGTQALLTGDPRSVTVTVTPGVPVIVSPASVFGTIGQPFSYQIIATNGPTSYGATGLPGTLTVNPTTGLISGTPLTSSPINATISATANGNTGSSPLTITINLNSQTITFGAQTSPQTFSAGGTFMIAPLATGGGSGNPVTYNTATPPVCAVTAPTVLMLSAGICTITANQAGNATFNAAAQVTQNVTINPVVPSAPTIGAATPADGQATVAFTASTFNGGSTITSYTLRCVGPNTVTASGSGSPLTAAGLTNGASYACNVFAINAAGNSPDSGTVNVTPSALPPLALVSVVSRKTHGAAGNFNVPINPLTIPTGLVDVEPRVIGAGHTLVFSFNNPITAVGAVSTTAGSAVSVASGNDVIVTLTAVPDNSRVTVTLTSVNIIPTPFAASMGFLIGDVNTTRSVTASDISGVKARSGQATTSLNFRFDVNATGAISASDISAVKARSGLTLPP